MRATFFSNCYVVCNFCIAMAFFIAISNLLLVSKTCELRITDFGLAQGHQLRRMLEQTAADAQLDDESGADGPMTEHRHTLVSPLS